MKMRTKKFNILNQYFCFDFSFLSVATGQWIKQKLKVHCVGRVSPDIYKSLTKDNIWERDHFFRVAQIVNAQTEFFSKQQGISVLIPDKKIAQWNVIKPEIIHMSNAENIMETGRKFSVYVSSEATLDKRQLKQ